MRDLSLHLLDIMQNSIAAKAGRIVVTISADSHIDELVIKVEDNGVGMDEEQVRKVIDPFVTTRTTRKVGLGIPLFKATVERAGGSLLLDSEVGKGTLLTASLKISHIDRPPLGNVAETITNLILSEPGIEFETVFMCGCNSFKFNSFEVKDKLGDVPITRFEVLDWIREYVDEGIGHIFGGVLNEIHS